MVVVVSTVPNSDKISPVLGLPLTYITILTLIGYPKLLYVNVYTKYCLFFHVAYNELATYLFIFLIYSLTN